MQGAHILEANVAEAMARYLTLLRGPEAAGATAASYRFFTPDMMVPVWQVQPSLTSAHAEACKPAWGSCSVAPT